MAWYQSEEEQRRNTLEVQAERLCVEKKEMEEGAERGKTESQTS